MEKLSISFWIWAAFDTGNGVYHDCDARMKELVDRGFNCVRMESCAGLFNAPDGTPRGDIYLHAPFGKFSVNARQFNIDKWEGTFNPRERILKLFRAADKYGVKIILSSWYYLHTNWFFDEEINEPLFAMTTAEKMSYFGKELGTVLRLLKENDLIHVVAFAELFNEFNGVPFASKSDGSPLEAKDAMELRDMHETVIDELHAEFPDTKLAFDITGTFSQEELTPRNVDVLNYHCYSLWDLYAILQKDMFNIELTEPDYPPEVRRFMKPESEWTTVAEVIAERGKIRTGLDWNRRCALFESLDPKKFPELEKALEDDLVRDFDFYFDALKTYVDNIVAFRDKVLPGRDLVFGEGVTYCYAQDLLFEEHSRTYWNLLEKQIKMFRDKGFSGAIVRTTDGPEDPSWTENIDDYRRLNALFQGK